MQLIQYLPEKGPLEAGEQIIALEQTAWPSGADQAVFPSAPHTYVTSFAFFEHGKAVCHVGIRKALLLHNGGQDEREEDALGNDRVTGHYRFDASRLPEELRIAWEG